MTVSIEDVAARAGVSTATVSRALRGLPNVSDLTRERVRDAARALDYVVSPSASSLATGRTNTVGVVVPYVGRWFFGQVIAGAESALRQAGFDLLLYTVGTDGSRRRFFEDLPVRRRVDALLVLALPLTESEVASIAGLRLPTAMVGATVPGFSSVRIDDVGGATKAVNHLINLGHRRIAMIHGAGIEPAQFTAPEDRRRGFRSALASAGLECDPSLEVDGVFTLAGGERAMASLLSAKLPPTAVFAQSDEMAFGALRAIRRAGLRCPEDVSVVGFDDHEMAEMLDLTTVAQPVVEQGVLAVGHIMAELRGEAAPSDELVTTHVVIRGTTAPPSARPLRARPPVRRTAPGAG
jgi:LacI family transcriptional regulator, repressor for deo operon, udp, cdd, tsx, nupC, and nupG